MAETLISDIISPLRLDDTGMYALDQMAEHHVRHLPIVDGDQLIGLISEDDVLNFDHNSSIRDFKMHYSRPSASIDNHLYEILRLMADFRLSVIPVMDHQDRYRGMITQENLLEQLGNMGSFTVPGSIIVLEMLLFNSMLGYTYW